MVVLTVENVSKSFGVQTLFEDVSFGISTQDKVGIIGVNGTGKSTLLRILLGLEVPDNGKVSKAREARLEFLDQDPDLLPHNTALDEVLRDGPEEFQVVQKYDAICRELSENPSSVQLQEKLSQLTEQMDRVSGWSLENDAKTILSQLGVDDFQQKIGTMSGGQQKRVALARALIRPADLLILDEPTNHLDVTTVAWLESYLQNRQSGLLLITHDRYFLDRVTNVILEVADKTVYRYEGNYSKYLELRAERDALAAVTEQKRAQLAKRELEWLRRGPKARTTKNKARISRAHDLLNSGQNTEKQNLEIQTIGTRLGKKVVEIEGLTKRFDGRTVVKDFTYVMPRDERIGIVGPNGAGKSTLLNMIAGRISPDEGTVVLGETVKLGYYDQTALNLDETTRVHDYITEVASHVETSDGLLSATQLLEQFLFDRTKQWTVIGKLSGGEKRRLYLLRILMQQPNVLLMDEPTNDLDIETLVILENYLENFGGAVVVVSHDRYFLDRTVDHLFVFQSDGSVVEFPGNYSIWWDAEVQKQREISQQQALEAQQQREKAAAAAMKVEAKPQDGPRKLSYKEARELESLQKRMPDIEGRLEVIDTLMIDHAADYERVASLHDEKTVLEQELETLLERWMELEG